VAVVGSDVPVRQVVVEEVAEALAEGDGYDGREVEESDAFGLEAVAADFARGFEEDG